MVGDDRFMRVCLIYLNTLTQFKIHIFFLWEYLQVYPSALQFTFWTTLTCSAFKFQKLYSAIYRSQAALLRKDQFHPQKTSNHIQQHRCRCLQLGPHDSII